MNTTYGVYFIVNKINDKFYIGGAYEARFKGRYRNHDWTKHHNMHLRNSAKNMEMKTLNLEKY